MPHQYEDRRRRWRRFDQRENVPRWDERGMDTEAGWEFPDRSPESSWSDESMSEYRPRWRGDWDIERDLERNRRFETGKSRGYSRGREDMSYAVPYTFTYSEYWAAPGPYTGVGPRSYRRSDERIFEDVCERLTQHGQIDASDVEVQVEDGEVTLTGEVGSRWEKRAIEDTIDSITGVKDIHNRLKLRSKQRADQFGGNLQNQIHEGMEVVDVHGEKAGNVKEVRGNDFLVDRPMARDLYIPFDAAKVEGGKARLRVSSDKIEDQGWPAPDVFVTPDIDRENE